MIKELTIEYTVGSLKEKVVATGEFSEKDALNFIKEVEGGSELDNTTLKIKTLEKEPELKPCPFCGSEPALETTLVGSKVECYECNIGHTCGDWTKEAAVNNWNKRTENK